MQQSYIRSRATARRQLAFRALLAAIALLMAGALASPQFAVSAAIAPTILGTAQSFLVLGGSTVTNTGPTTVTGGNLGVSPGAAITGFPPGIVVAPGTMHAADAVAAQAQSDVTTAYTTLAGQARTATLTGQDLGGKTLTQGVYFFATSAQLTGQLTLNAQGDPAAVFVFQIGSTLTTASNASVLFINGASPCNVYWQVGSSATLGTTTAFVGNILALTSITLNTGATIAGRALARNGAVTMDTNTLFASVCAPGIPTGTPVTPTGTPVASTGTPIVPTGTPVTSTGTPIVPTGAPIIRPTGTSIVPTGMPITRPIGTPVTSIGTSVISAGTPVASTGTSVTSTGTSVTSTGTSVTSTPISGTLPLVGIPASAAATAPIPAGMPNTGGGGLATHVTTSSVGVNDHHTTGVLWMVIAALVAFAGTGLLLVRRARR
ncbi:MAG: ice-binding family protein [Thermomicrobiales bacterium]